MKWFKFFGQDWLTDTKILSLSLEDKMCYLTILCLVSASENGYINSSEEVIIHLSRLDSKSVGVLTRLSDNKMITYDNDGSFTVKNFIKRQGESLTGYERVKKWRERNVEESRNMNRIQRLKKFGLDSFITTEEWQKILKKYNYQCVSCKSDGGKYPLEVDHIKPLSKGGLDNIKNVQPLCRSCNASKSNSDDNVGGGVDDNAKSNQIKSEQIIKNTDKTSKEVVKIIESDSKEIPLLMKEFESINPAVKRMYSNKTQRQACSDLIKTYTFDKVIQVIKEILPQIKGQPFFPEISTPYELFNKWSKLESAIIRYGKEKNIKSKVAF